MSDTAGYDFRGFPSFEFQFEAMCYSGIVEVSAIGCEGHKYWCWHQMVLNARSCAELLCVSHVPTGQGFVSYLLSADEVLTALGELTDAISDPDEALDVARLTANPRLNAMSALNEERHTRAWDLGILLHGGATQ